MFEKKLVEQKFGCIFIGIKFISFFYQEPLKGRSFTFWEWFHGALEVVRKHLKEYWKDQ